MSEQPTILPWHREAATDIHETPLPTMSQYVNITECMEARIDRLSAIIARHDAGRTDSPAQHATTLRLLEDALPYLLLTDKYGRPCQKTMTLHNAISAHLAAQQQTGGGK